MADCPTHPGAYTVDLLCIRVLSAMPFPFVMVGNPAVYLPTVHEELRFLWSMPYLALGEVFTHSDIMISEI